MSQFTLVIGNKNYSSWSLRPWLLMKHLGLEFTEIKISLYKPESKEQLLHYSPSGRVPVLLDGRTTVWESLAICEYVAERWPAAWPAGREARALARSVATEMHAGFGALRAELPLNCRARRSGVIPSEAAKADIARITAIWQTCRDAHGSRGPWLFGNFTVADAMFAPVALRFYTYGVPLAQRAAAYVKTVLEDPSVSEWLQAAREETEIIPEAERGEPLISI